MMTAPKLTNKQQAFVNEYLIDLNATQAAIRAGYSKKTAKDIACENLAKPYIKEAIDSALAERAVRTQVTSDKVLAELAKLGYSNMEDYVTIGNDGLPTVDLSNMTREQMAAISEVTVETRKEPGENGGTIEKVKFKLENKGQNLERLGRHLKLFTDKVEHSGEIKTIVLQDDVDALTN